MKELDRFEETLRQLSRQVNDIDQRLIYVKNIIERREFTNATNRQTD